MRLYLQITFEERRVIQNLQYSHISKTDMSKYLQRDRSTLYREFQRNKTRGYNYKEADRLARTRKTIRKKKADVNGILRLIICSLLMDKNSPEVISYYLKVLFPNDTSMHWSYESIYQWIYEQKDCNGKSLLTQYLFTKRKNRQNRSNIYKSRGLESNKRNIRERPLAAEHKTEYGHLEGDLIESKGRDAYMLTLVDRKLKHTWGSPLFTKDSETVSRAIIEVLEYLPENFVKTITFDNGGEFASYSNIEKAINCKVYFADPYCAWQRGLNEHINSRIRQYLPKNKSFAYLTDEICEDILESINNRPRKSLGWNTPKEFLEDAICCT